MDNGEVVSPRIVKGSMSVMWQNLYKHNASQQPLIAMHIEELSKLNDNLVDDQIKMAYTYASDNIPGLDLPIEPLMRANGWSEEEISEYLKNDVSEL